MIDGKVRAYEAGFKHGWDNRGKEIDRIKEQVRAEERERCARIAERHSWEVTSGNEGPDKWGAHVCTLVAAAIRGDNHD